MGARDQTIFQILHGCGWVNHIFLFGEVANRLHFQFAWAHLAGQWVHQAMLAEHEESDVEVLLG